MLVIRSLSRPEQLFEGINQSLQIGLEIGALDNPCAQRTVGTVYYADYCSTSQLKVNHEHTPSVDTSALVEVDFVTGGGPLRPVIPAGLMFDYVVASHVIEHVPDIISWLQDLGSVIKPHGILSLIVPNKEATFDLRRSVSEQKDFFAAYVQKQTRPSPIQVFDFYRWHERDGELVHNLPQSVDKAEQAMNNYVDSHCWVFTPESFHHEISILAAEGWIPFKVDKVTLTPPGEIDMFARLIRTNDAPPPP